MTMPATVRTAVAADCEKLKGFVLKPGSSTMNARHSQAGAIGMGLIIHFVDRQRDDVTEIFNAHEVIKQKGG